jgi:flagellar biosynthesis chaperone FliJ
MDYENQILEGAKTGTSVAFIQDANAFREKLLLSSAEISNQIKGLSMNSDQALKIAMQAKMRSQGLGKLVAKAHLRPAGNRLAPRSIKWKITTLHAFMGVLARKMLS